MKPLPLFGEGIKSQSSAVTAQRRLNCFFDIRKDGDKEAVIVRGTPGSQLWVTLPTYPIRGWHAVNDVLYIVSGGIFYTVATDGTVTSRGAVSSTSGKVSIDDNGIEVGIVDGVAGYIYTIASTSFATISDPNFPNGATTIAFLNGRFYVNNPGTRQCHVGGSYAGSTWTPAIFFTKENSSDLLVAVEVLGGNLILWGANSMEFWQDIGASPVPVQRINGATQTCGLAAVWSRVQVNSSELFLGKHPNGGVQVMKLNGYNPVPVSNSDLENIINGFSTYSDAAALAYMIDGHPMYQLTFPTGGRSFIYDDSTGVWGEAQTGLALLARHYGELGVVFNSLNYISDYESGRIYQLNQNVHTDNGAAIKRQVCSRHIQRNGNVFSIDELVLEMEVGVGLQNGQGSDPQIMVEVSKDGGNTFKMLRYLRIGAVGEYFKKIFSRRWGQSDDFVFRITLTDPVKFVLIGANCYERRQQGMKEAMNGF